MSLLDCANELVLHFEPLNISFGVSTAVKYLILFDSGTTKLRFYRNNPNFNIKLFVLKFLNKIKTNIFKYCYIFFNKYDQFLFGTSSQVR